jgi:hypothetical protein
MLRYFAHMKQGGDMLGKRDQVLLSFEGVLLSRAYNCETRSSRTSEQPSADTPRLVNVIDVHAHGTIPSRLRDVPFLFQYVGGSIGILHLVASSHQPKQSRTGAIIFNVQPHFVHGVVTFSREAIVKCAEAPSRVHFVPNAMKKGGRELLVQPFRLANHSEEFCMANILFVVKTNRRGSGSVYTTE